MKLHKLIFVLGASGSGKTHALKAIERDPACPYAICRFDSLGVPSEAEAVAKWGGWDGWYKMRMGEWMKIIVERHLPNRMTVLDGQFRPELIADACREHGVSDYGVVLIDCSDEERARRLVARGHPELANETLPAWAKLLREEYARRGWQIIDNTRLSEEEGRRALERALADLAAR